MGEGVVSINQKAAIITLEMVDAGDAPILIKPCRDKIIEIHVESDLILVGANKARELIGLLEQAIKEVTA